MQIGKFERSLASSSLHGLGESPVPASSVVVCLSIFFLVFLCLVFRIVHIYMPVVECGYVPFFADVLSIYSCILLYVLVERTSKIFSKGRQKSIQCLVCLALRCALQQHVL
jgi:hypothetical protein